MKRDMIVVLVTCGSKKEAGKIARTLVEKRVAACVNTVTAPVRSVYRWKGKVEEAVEQLLVIKTTRQQFKTLQRTVEGLHSYDVPEVIALPIANGAELYLAWVAESVGRSGLKRHASHRGSK